MRLKDYIANWVNNEHQENFETQMQGFIIIDDRLYVENKTMKTLFAFKEGGQIHLRFRNDVKKYLRKFLNHCKTENILLKSRIGETMEYEHFFTITNTFKYYVTGDLYDVFHDNNLDIFRLVANYVDYYDCEEDFYRMFDDKPLDSSRRYSRRGPVIGEVIRGKYLRFNWVTLVDDYIEPETKYLEELDIDNLKRRFKLEKLFKNLKFD